MAKRLRTITEAHRDFIGRQHIFFVASSAMGSHVNLSPRSTDSFRILSETSVAYLDRTGSGNETAAHIRAGGRMTIMFCAFDGAPSNLRLYGQGVVHHRRSQSYAQLLREHFGGKAPSGTRQIVGLDMEFAQISCGYGVPLFDYQGERPNLDKWLNGKDEAGIEAYWQKNNLNSLDGLPTGLLAEKDR